MLWVELFDMSLALAASDTLDAYWAQAPGKQKLGLGGQSPAVC